MRQKYSTVEASDFFLFYCLLFCKWSKTFYECVKENKLENYKIGKVYSLEYNDFQRRYSRHITKAIVALMWSGDHCSLGHSCTNAVWGHARVLGHFCGNPTRGYCWASGHSCTSTIRVHCCAPMCSNNDFSSHCCATMCSNSGRLGFTLLRNNYLWLCRLPIPVGKRDWLTDRHTWTGI